MNRNPLVGLALLLPVGLVTLIASLLGMLTAIVAPRRGLPWVARSWARVVLAIFGVRAVAEGHVPGEPPFVVMANHTSHFDVLALYVALPFPVRFVAKRELGYIPFFGWALRMGAAVMVDRHDRQQAFRALDKAGALIREGASVILFPEGTRTPPRVVWPLKKGPIHLAQAARVPVLPIGILGSADVLPKHALVVQPGTIRVRIGAPIELAERTGEADRPGILAEVRARLAELSESELVEPAPKPGATPTDTRSLVP